MKKNSFSAYILNIFALYKKNVNLTCKSSHLPILCPKHRKIHSFCKEKARKNLHLFQTCHIFAVTYPYQFLIKQEL